MSWQQTSSCHEHIRPRENGTFATEHVASADTGGDTNRTGVEESGGSEGNVATDSGGASELSAVLLRAEPHGGWEVPDISQ